MELRAYLKGKSRKDFAGKIGRSVNYLNNLCQHPEQCGKITARRIEQATDGAVTIREMLFPEP